MILTVEIPHEGRPSCWFAFDEDDFIRKARVAWQSADGIVFGSATPRELLAARGCPPDAPGIADLHADLLRLATTYGWDTLLYRADYLLPAGHYQIEAVTEFVAHVAAVAQGLKTCRVYLDEEQAMDALYSDSLYAGKQGFHAHMALREQLIALEVMSDDL